MDDKPRKSSNRNRSDSVFGCSRIADSFNLCGKPTEASWYKEKDWFTIQEACELMECSYRTMMRWIESGAVYACFPPNTEGKGNWHIHADSIANRPK